MNRSVFKNVYIIVISLLTVAAVIFGTIIHMGGLLGDISGFFGFSSDKLTEATITTDAFTSVELDADAGNFSIVYGDNYSIYYNLPEKLVPTYTIENKTLKIKSTGKHFAFNFFGNSSGKYSITLTIPKDTVLDSTSLDISAGDIDLKNIAFNSLFIDTSAGNVNIDKVTAENLEIDTSAGNINLDNVTVKNLKADTNAGNIDSRNLKAESIKADTSMGNIDFNAPVFTEANFDSSMGDIDISVTDAFKKLTANCSMGSVNFKYDRTVADEEISLTTNMGEIEVNGTDMGHSYKN